MALIRPIPKTDITVGSVQTGSSPLTLEVGKTYIVASFTDLSSSGANTVISGADIITQPTKFVGSGTEYQIDLCAIKATSTSVRVTNSANTNLTNIAYIKVE